MGFGKALVVIALCLLLVGCTALVNLFKPESKTQEIFNQGQTEALQTATSNILASGNFSSPPGDQSISGSYEIITVVSTNITYLSVLPGFSVNEGPDLHFLLSPKEPGELSNNNAANDALDLGLIQRFSGAQIYEIPTSASLNVYKTVLVHCVGYKHLFGGSSLSF